MTIPIVNQGQDARRGGPLSAAVWNRVREAVNAVHGMRGGPGILVRRDGNGISISLDESVRFEIEGLITTVHGASGPLETTPQVPSSITYSVRPLGMPELADAVGLSPTLGRPVKNDEVRIWTALPNDRCKLIMQLTAEGPNVVGLRIESERVAFGDCESGGLAQMTLAQLDARIASLEAQLSKQPSAV